MTEKVFSSHDRFCQSTLENKSVALALCKAVIKPELRQQIDWSTFGIADTARRLTSKKPTQTDITYYALIKGTRGYIYFHIEHQRTIDYTMVERILEYNVGLFFKHRKQKSPKLPLIVNIVIYNGTKEDYPYHEDLYQYFEQPELARSLMSQSYILVNLAKETDEKLLSHGLCGPMEVLLKRASDANFAQWLSANKALLQSQGEIPYVREGLTYALEVGKGKAEQIAEAFASTYPELEGTIMRAIKQIERKGEEKGRKEGRQEGMQQGIQTRNLEIAKGMLRKGYTFDVVEELTGLGSERLHGLQ